MTYFTYKHIFDVYFLFGILALQHETGNTKQDAPCARAREREREREQTRSKGKNVDPLCMLMVARLPPPLTSQEHAFIASVDSYQ